MALFDLQYFPRVRKMARSLQTSAKTCACARGPVGVVKCDEKMVDQSFSSSFSELLATARGYFTWPDDVTLYRLPEDRELLPDKIQRLCFETYLQLCNLNYNTQIARNADAMSPTGTAPFLTVRIGAHLSIFSNFNKLVLFLETQSLGLDSQHLDTTQRPDNAAFISLITTRMIPAEVYQTWLCSKNSREFTMGRYGSGMVWPLTVFLPRFHRFEFIWNNWNLYTETGDKIMRDFEAACKALESRLGQNEAFFTNGVSSLDVLVFSHVQAILTTPLPDNKLCQIASGHRKLVEYTQTFAHKHNLCY